MLQIKWGLMDDDASWLRPGRLLLFLQLNCSTGRSGACDDTMPASLTVDGSSIRGIKAYESRCTVRPQFPLVYGWCHDRARMIVTMLLCFAAVDVRRNARTSIIHLTRGHRYAPAYLSLSYILDKMYN